MKSNLHRIIFFFAVLLLSSCATQQEYERLLASAESKPSKQAVVGMWHARRNDFDGGKLRMSMLVRKDGTGMVDAYYGGILGTKTTGFDALGKFQWTYTGNGVWQLRSLSKPGLEDECRISGGVLLRRGGGVMSASRYLIYDRVTE